MTRPSDPTDFPLPQHLAPVLLGWYDRCRRILPWREDPTPYHVWISEIMLQQTRVDTVLPYYRRFLGELPDVEHLASVSEDRLLKLWEGLGYYSRARNLQKAAQQIVREHGGTVPRDPAVLRKLSGIGDYTAAAIASIAYGVPVPSVDGNLLRVWARLTGYAESIRTPAAKKLAGQAFTDALPADRPGDMNQAWMDLGATVCLPNGAPLCAQCPLAELCEAHRSGREALLPVPEEKAERAVDRKTVLLIRSGDSVLLRRRPAKGLLAGLYEFPNEDGTLPEAAVRDWCEKLGLAVRTIAPLPPARHVFTHRIWEMTGWELETIVTDPAMAEASGAFFVPAAQVLSDFSIPSAFSAYSGKLGAFAPE